MDYLTGVLDEPSVNVPDSMVDNSNTERIRRFDEVEVVTFLIILISRFKMILLNSVATDFLLLKCPNYYRSTKGKRERVKEA